MKRIWIPALLVLAVLTACGQKKAAPQDAPEKRPSVKSATVVSNFMPTIAEVGESISRIPGPPAGPS